MVFFTALLMMSYITMASAEVGKVLKLSGPKEAFVMRGERKIPLSLQMDLELNDRVFSSRSDVLIYLYPATQMALSKGTEIHLSDASVNFIKGLIRLDVSKDQKVQAEDVAFDLSGSEAEISLDRENNVDLDVFKGEVVVSSPHVHTFVPEVVKAKEGFRFESERKGFARRKFTEKYEDHPKFENMGRLQKKWKRP